MPPLCQVHQLLKLDTMKVIINNEEVDTSAKYLLDLINELQLNSSQIAIAVEKQIVQRQMWDNYPIMPGAKITIITVACGG